MAVLAVALVLSGYGAAVAIGGFNGKGGSTSTVTTTVTNSTTSSPFVITLVLTNANTFNSTVGQMPSFYLLGPNGLESAAKLSLPAHRMIKLVIVNYDEGNATLNVPNDNVVSGTSDGTIFVASNSNINSSQGAAGIVVKGGAQVTSVLPKYVAHTFTVPDLNLDIPLPVSSTVVAFFSVDKAGTYLWYCMTACGDPAMSSPGWMRGSLVAS
ncbi:MAG: hypothetical protein OK436_04690 [Thaumarchaeota archaeon]|nr:hypothetical protein [Nitrososphaerota archaeon]